MFAKNPGLRAEVRLMHSLAAQATSMGQSQIGTGDKTGRGSSVYLEKSYVNCRMNEHRSLQLKCINSENQLEGTSFDTACLLRIRWLYVLASYQGHHQANAGNIKYTGHIC